ILVPVALVRQRLPAPTPAGLVELFGGSLPATLPTTGVVLPSQLLELTLDAMVAGVAAMSLGLLVSAIVTDTDQAAFLLPVMLVAQIAVSVPLLGPPKPILHELGFASATQWGTAAVASTVSLNELREPFLAGLE